MKTKIHIILFAILASVFFAAPGFAVVQVGDIAPDFVLSDTNGKLFKLSAKKDTVLVFMFMGYSCGSCKAEAPSFEQNIHKKYMSTETQFFGLDLWDGTASIIQSSFVVPTGVTFPILMQASSIGFLYGVGTSNYMIVGKDGIVKYIGRYYDEAALKENLDTLTNTKRTGNNAAPGNFRLEQNYPNPFNPTTRISYEIRLKEPTLVQLKVYNIIGVTERTLVNGVQASGFYDVTWDGTNDLGEIVPGGIYLYELRAGGQVTTKRMLFLK